MNILITGGAGFIGSAVIRNALSKNVFNITTIDNLTYAGNLNSLTRHMKDKRFRFVEGNICDLAVLNDLFDEFKPEAVMHLAAESHVDRSIYGPRDFIETNIIGDVYIVGGITKILQKFIIR
jgi:dTDP-glucose 4,6-dehydratase